MSSLYIRSLEIKSLVSHYTLNQKEKGSITKWKTLSRSNQNSSRLKTTPEALETLGVEVINQWWPTGIRQPNGEQLVANSQISGGLQVVCSKHLL